MSEQTKDVNPYDTDNMPEGGGLTREIVVTGAKYVSYGLTRKDGSPVIDDRTKQQSVFTGARIDALSIDPGREQRPGKYEFSTGKKGRPSADGEQLLNEDGSLAKIYQSSAWGEALLLLEKGGFDKKTLHPKLSVLVGAKITLEGRNKIGADGKPKTHVYEGKTYNDIEWVPVKFNGYAQGGAPSVSTGAAGGNGADLTAKAEAAVVAAIAEVGGTIARKDLIRALGTALKGDPDAVKVTTLVARQDFHTGRPWTFDAAAGTLSL